MRTIRQTWGTQINAWDGISVLDNRMTSTNKRSPAPGGSWDSVFLVSSTNYMLLEADQQAKAFNQGELLSNLFVCFSSHLSSSDFCSSGFTIEYRYVSHAETWAESPKTRLTAGGPLGPLNIGGNGAQTPLSPWPYFSSLFYVCLQSEALAPGAAITVNINQA